MIIKIEENGDFLYIVEDIRKEIPNVSFPEDLSLAVLPDGYKHVNVEIPEYREGFNIEMSTKPVLENDIWVLKVIYTPEEVIESTSEEPSIIK